MKPVGFTSILFQGGRTNVALFLRAGSSVIREYRLTSSLRLASYFSIEWVVPGLLKGSTSSEVSNLGIVG
jgi:hypothetical protein